MVVLSKGIIEQYQAIAPCKNIEFEVKDGKRSGTPYYIRRAKGETMSKYNFKNGRFYYNNKEPDENIKIDQKNTKPDENLPETDEKIEKKTIPTFTTKSKEFPKKKHYQYNTATKENITIDPNDTELEENLPRTDEEIEKITISQFTTKSNEELFDNNNFNKGTYKKETKPIATDYKKNNYSLTIPNTPPRFLIVSS